MYVVTIALNPGHLVAEGEEFSQVQAAQGVRFRLAQVEPAAELAAEVRGPVVIRLKQEVMEAAQEILEAQQILAVEVAVAGEHQVDQVLL